MYIPKPTQNPERALATELRTSLVEGSNNSRLKVQFFWPFKGDYYILDLDPNYQWAMIGEPSRKYFWILSRDKKMKEGLYNDLIRKAKEEFGYDTNQVVMTDQSCE